MQRSTTFATTTYAQFGEYLGQQNPYSRETTLPEVPATGGGPVSPDIIIRPDLDLYWDFRDRTPGDEPDRPRKKLDVINYRIVKAIVIRYKYIREGDGKTLWAHIVVGYTAPSVDAAGVGRTAPPEEPAAQGGYPRLGQFIRAENPFHAKSTLPVDVSNPHDPELKLAISWLADKSAASGDVASSSDDEMQLIEKQQCLNWDFPQPYLQHASDGSGAGWWMRNYQVTKAIRVPYSFNADGEGGTVRYKGDLLVGYAGAGDM